MSINWYGLQGLGWWDLLQLAGHFALLSLLAVGGAITLASEMQRYLVVEHGWIDALQFNASIAIAQHKAKAAATFRRPTLVFERLLGRGPFFSYLATLDGVIASRGGNPIVVNGKIIGAIGVSGGTGSQEFAAGMT